jgi:hypothetical protein
MLPFIRLGLGWSLPARVVLAIAGLAPLGGLMGMPFVLGLRRLEAALPGATPWAWGVNGAASGLAGVAAALIGLELGTDTTLALAGLAYAIAWLTAGGLVPRPVSSRARLT